MNPAVDFDFSHWQVFLLSFIPLLINIGIFTYVFLRFPDSRANFIFVLFIICLCIWQALDSLIRISANDEMARVCQNMLSPFINLVTPLALHFALVFGNQSLKNKPIILVLIYLPSLLFIFASTGGFITYDMETSETWNRVIVLREEPVPLLNLAWISITAFITLAVFIANIKKNKGSGNLEKQSILIAIGFGIPVVQGVLTEVIIPYVFNAGTIPLTSTFISAFSICVLIAFKKYKLTSFSPRNVFYDVMQNIDEGILIVDNEEKVKYANPRFCKLVGYEPEEILEKNTIDLFVDNKVYQRHVIEATERRKKKISDRYELKVRKKNGDYIYCEISGSPYIDTSGNIIGSIGVVTDITYRRETEKQLKKYNLQLEQKNKMLEQFVFIASHDLQEPLRTVSGFVDLFEKKYGAQMNGNSEVYLKYIKDSTLRMQTLVKDLLDYSRIGKSTELKDIDCNQLTDEVICDLDALISEKQAIIHKDPLPKVLGYRTELKLLLQNLVGNALKFHKKDSVPEVTISSRETELDYIFFIEDNGIGIREEYAEKIFTVFHRLHTRNEYEGNGIGLAHCKKITELHGGTIGVKSIPGVGSRFYFTLPKNPK